VSAEIALVGDGDLGAAIGERLRADGRTVSSDPTRLESVRLVLLDCAPDALADTIAAIADRLDGNHLVVHCVRGEAWHAIHDNTAVRRIGVLAGPLDAAELRAGRPSAAVVASRHPEVVEEFATALSTPRLRVYRSRDPIGVELARELVDLFVVACGLADALELGDGARAVLITRAVRELERMIAAVGGEPSSANGLGGLGDLLVRAANPNDPAFQLGRGLRAGAVPSDDLRATAHRLRTFAESKRVQAHIVRGIAAALEGRMSPSDLVGALMTVPVLDD
jgi:glycerol-3-phosphate dehydrogenase (NAD(P)+)